jgi:hypothetical protein
MLRTLETYVLSYEGGIWFNAERFICPMLGLDVAQ